MSLNDEPTLKDVMSPKARAWTYIGLSTLTPVATTLLAVLQDGWQNADALLIGTTLTASAGLLMARSNTPAAEPPPAV